MKRLIKIACLAVGASVLAGLALYGGIMAMYRLAHALSLPPVLTNLLPLAVIGVLWFIASPARCIANFLWKLVVPALLERKRVSTAHSVSPTRLSPEHLLLVAGH